MQFGEAVVLGASPRPDGRLEVELHAVCPGANFERLNIVLGGTRVAVPLDRPARGALRSFKVTLPAEASLNQGDKMPVEFFFPGEQGGLSGGDWHASGLN
ncbi:MAG TPA: hypothetical protein VGD78_00900 [Chthoniobacterales bacterium]